MKHPLHQVKVEIWDTSSNFVKHGVQWYMRLAWFLTNRRWYNLVTTAAKNDQFFARGIYDNFNRRIIICLDDIQHSVERAAAIVEHVGEGSVAQEKTFILQFYLTLVHELLHHCRVSDTNCIDGHHIDLVKFEKLHPLMKIIFDNFLMMRGSGDSFTDHPENRRPE